jgi:hypothetical protein
MAATQIGREAHQVSVAVATVLLFLLALSALAVAVIAAVTTWRTYVRSLPRRRHPIRWAFLLVPSTALPVGFALLLLVLQPYTKYTASSAVELAILTGQTSGFLRARLRQRPRPVAPYPPYRPSSGDRLVGAVGLGVFVSGFLIIVVALLIHGLVHV